MCRLGFWKCLRNLWDRAMAVSQVIVYVCGSKCELFFGCIFKIIFFCDTIFLSLIFCTCGEHMEKVSSAWGWGVLYFKCTFHLFDSLYHSVGQNE